MLQAGKYDVFKYDPPNPSRRLDEDTFFVLRANDALATMTLRSYVANVLQVIDWGRDPVTGEPLTDEQVEDLAKLADGAHTLANEWAKRNHKIPD